MLLVVYQTLSSVDPLHIAPSNPSQCHIIISILKHLRLSLSLVSCSHIPVVIVGALCFSWFLTSGLFDFHLSFAVYTFNTWWKSNFGSSRQFGSSTSLIYSWLWSFPEKTSVKRNPIYSHSPYHVIISVHRIFLFLFRYVLFGTYHFCYLSTVCNLLFHN